MSKAVRNTLPCEDPKSRLDHFVNREQHQRTAREVLTRPWDEPLPVLIFQGMGGMGKSCVMAKIQVDVCLRHELTANCTSDTHPVPHVWVDFADAGATIDSDVRSPSGMLYTIKRQLHDVFRFHCFEVVWGRYLELRDGRRFEPARAPGSEYRALRDIAEKAAQTLGGPVGDIAGLISFLSEYGPEWYRLWRDGRLAPDGMEDWRNPEDARSHMATALAMDIIRERKRLGNRYGLRWPLLFFDSLEWLEPETDTAETIEAIEQLLAATSLTPVFMATRPPCPAAVPANREAKVIEVGLIPEGKRADYLKSRELRRRSWTPVLDATNGHALWMGVAADIAADVERREGRAVTRQDLIDDDESREKLLKRLLERLGRDQACARHLVRIGAVCRWFDRDFLRDVSGDPVNFAEGYKRLVRLSFVLPRGSSQEPPIYVLHETVRDLQMADILAEGDLGHLAKRAQAYCTRRRKDRDQDEASWAVAQAYYLWLADEKTAVEASKELIAHLAARWGKTAMHHQQELLRSIEDACRVTGHSPLPHVYWSAKARLQRLEGRYDEVAATHEQALQAASTCAERVEAMRGLAQCNRVRGNTPKALAILEEARACAFEAGDNESLLEVLSDTGETCRRSCQWERALSAYDDAQDLLNRWDLRRQEERTASVDNRRGLVHRELGEWQRAAELFRASLRLEGQKTSTAVRPIRISIALRNLGHIAWLTGDYYAAVEHLEKCLCIRRALGSSFGTADPLSLLGEIKIEMGNLTIARALLTEATSLYDCAGTISGQGKTAIREARLHILESAPGPALEAIAKAEHSLGESQRLDILSDLQTVKSSALLLSGSKHEARACALAARQLVRRHS